VKFYAFMWLSYLHLNAKWHLITIKYDEVTGILAWPLSDIRCLKNVCADTQQHRVTETTQWTHCLTFDSHFVCLNRSPSAFVHLFSHSVELLTALLISSYGRLSQTTWNASFSDFCALKIACTRNCYLKRRAGCQFNAVDITMT